MKREGIREFQAVVLAGGLGNRMYPLTEQIPKPLLPVANRPLLSFQLEMLERSGFSEVLVVVNSPAAEKVKSFVREEYKGKLEMKIEIATIEGTVGTADALRQVKDKIKTDFFVISGDLITNVFLHNLADVHRLRDAAVTVLLKECIEDKDEQEKEKKSKSKVEDERSQIIGLDSKASNRLIFIRSRTDVDKGLTLSKSVLRRHPHITFHTKLQDVHLYLFSHWVLDILVEKSKISSIQEELVPYLVKNQFTAATQKGKRPQTHEDDLVARMSHGSSQDVKLPESSSSSGCYAFIPSSNTYCVRVNTLAAYKDINHQVSTLVYEYMPWTPISQDNQIDSAQTHNPKSQLGGSVVGIGLKIGESSVKKSTIGKHCKIGNQVRISNSVIMDYVTIEDGCVIVNSILCSNSYISAKVSLTACQVGAAFVVPPAGTFKNEILCEPSVKFDE